MNNRCWRRKKTKMGASKNNSADEVSSHSHHAAPRPRVMGKSTKAGKAKGGPKQVPLAAVNFVPTLAKPTHAVGDFIALLGGEWPGCPASDKTKLLGAMLWAKVWTRKGVGLGRQRFFLELQYQRA